MVTVVAVILVFVVILAMLAALFVLLFFLMLGFTDMPVSVMRLFIARPLFGLLLLFGFSERNRLTEDGHLRVLSVVSAEYEDGRSQTNIRSIIDLLSRARH